MERSAAFVTSVAPTGTNKLNRPFRFSGQFFRRWAKKVLIYLKLMKVAWIINDDNPNHKDTAAFDEQQKRDHDTLLKNWVHDEEYCRNYILKCLSNELYDFYFNSYFSARKTRAALENKYDSEEDGTKKYACSHYFNFRMVEEKPVLEQIHDLQMIVHDIETEGIKIDEQMQVAAIIDKLPESWKEFQKTLLHKQSELKLVNLMARLRIEE